VILPLDDDNRIHGTATCWQLERRKVVKGGVEWRPYKYFVKVDDALREAAQREIRTHAASGFTEALQVVDAVVAKYSKLIDDSLEARLAALKKEAAA